MKKIKTSSSEAGELRKKAEGKLAAKKNNFFLPQTQEDSQKLLHELQVHQIELEMINEELQQTRDDLEISHGEFSDLYDFSPIGYFLLSLEGKITRLNLRGAAMLGIERSKLIKRSFRQFLTPDSYQEFDRLIQRAVATKIKEKCEAGYIQIISASDDSKKVSSKIETSTNYAIIEAILNVSEGELRIVMIDITERKMAEKTLSQSEERYRQLVELSPDPIVIHNGREVVFANQMAENVIRGKSSDQIIGKKIEDIIHPDYKNLAEERIKKFLRGEQVINPVEYKLKRFDGTYFYAEISSAPVKFEGGNAIQIIARDISERKLHEQELAKTHAATLNLMEDLNAEIAHRKKSQNALKESEKRFRLLYQNAPLPYQSLNEDGYLIDVNPTWLKTLGYNLDEVIGKHFSKFLLPKYKKLFNERFSKFKAKGEIHDAEFEMKRKDGSTIFVAYEGLVSKSELGGFKQTQCIFTDITERKQAEEKISRLNAQMQSAEKIANFGFLVWNLITNEIFISEETRRIYAIPEETLNVGEFINKIAHPDDLKYINENLDLALKGIKDYNIDHRIVLPDGTIKWLNNRAKLEKDENEKPIKLFGTVLDITERKQAEQKLRDSEEKFSKAFQTSPYAITISNLKDGRFIEVNDAFKSIFGFTSEEALLNSSIDLGLWVNLENRKEVLDDLKVGKLVGGREYKFKKKNGEIRTGLFSAQIIMLKKKPFILSSINDITERKQTEEKLRNSEENLKKAQSYAHVGSWTWDVKENKVEGSDEMYNLFNIKKETFSGYLPDVIANAIHPDDRLKVEKSNEYVLKEGKSIPLEYRVIKPDGTIRYLWAEASGLSLDVDGKPNQLTGFVQDITERKLLEQEIKANNEELRALSNRLQKVREDERLNLSREMHDNIGQALTGLKMDIAWLQKKTNEGKTNRELIEKRFDGMKALVDESINRIRRIASELRPSILDTFGLLPAIEWMLVDLQQRSGINCKYYTEMSDVKLDKLSTLQIFRIIQESLTNVARHSAATEVKINIKKQNNMLSFEVIDNGKGIPDEKLNKSKSLGMLGIRERAVQIGGMVSFKRGEAGGTIVTLKIAEGK